MASDIPGEVIAGALVLCMVFGGVAAKFSYDQAERSPVAFSEFGKTARAAEREGKEVPPLTGFYSLNNDAGMIVREAKNIANETNRTPLVFAKELENITDRSLRVHRQIGEYAALVPPAADKALAALSHLTKAADDLPAPISELKDSWSENHHHVYRTVRTQHRVCDAHGQNCRTKTEYHRRYDHTVHSYTYFPQHAENAYRLVDALLKRHPDLSIAEYLIRAAMTEADNEYVIEKSIFKGKMMSQEGLLKEANMWADGSTLEAYRHVITKRRSALEEIVPRFNSTRRTARDVTYPTYFKTDSGPEEFQVARKTLDHAQTIYDSIHKVVDGIAYARDAVPELDATIRQLIAVRLDGEKGDANALQKKIMEIVTTNHDMNYEGARKVNEFDWGLVILASMIGGAAGAAAGAGVARYRELHP